MINFIGMGYINMRTQIALNSMILLLVTLTGCGGGAGNSAPTATGVSITDGNAGSPEVGDDLTGSYTYDDQEDDVEATSTFRWLRDGTAITGETITTYTIVSADVGKDISFEVTPIAETGTTKGNPISSTDMAIGNAATAAALKASKTYAIYLNTTQDFELGSDSDQTHQYAISAQPSNGILTGQLSGHHLLLTYTPTHDYVGTETIGFTVTHDSGDQASGEITINVLNQIDGMRDTDGDGLSDLDESNFYGTSPVLADTDADGFTDFAEIVTYGFDANVNNFRFNPLIADVPQIDIELVSAPDIFLNYTESDGTSSSVSTSRSESSSSTVSSSKTNAQSTSFEHAHSAALTVGTSSGFEENSAKHVVDVSLTLGSSIAFGEETSNSWTEEQSQENATALEQGKAFEESNTINTSSGGIFVNVRIKNTGHISYRLNNLYLNASYFDLSHNNPSVPIGNLAFENQVAETFPAFTLAPGESSGIINYTTSDLTIATTRSLLEDSQGLTIRPAIFDLISQDDSSFIFNQTGIQAQDATVMIDFGGFNTDANLTKLIATNADPDNTGISIADALQNTLQLDISVDGTDGFIDSIESISNKEPNGYWVILHAAQSGNNEIITTIYTTPTDKSRVQSINSGVLNLVSNYDINNIRLHGGDVLHLVYMLDDDLDGLSNRDEFLHRTDINNPDTDGDGLTDYAEVTGWKVSYIEITGSSITEEVTSDPLTIDTDGDQITDYDEANINESDITLKRNPRSIDTDDDGIYDLTDDRDNSGIFLANIYDKIDIAKLENEIITNDVTVTYETYDITEQGAGSPGNGIDEYIVHIYRHIATDGVHPEPLSPPTDYIPNALVTVGSNLSCGSGCSWELVNKSTNIPLAGSHAFTDGTAITAGDDYKYIAYFRLNGRYYRSHLSSIASAATEIVTIHMVSGNLNNVKTLADNRTIPTITGRIYYSADYDEIYYQRGYRNCFYYGGDPFYSSSCGYGDIYKASTGEQLAANVYYDRCPVTQYTTQLSETCWTKQQSYSSAPIINRVTDEVVANDLPPYTHPLGDGDGRFTLNWRLRFNGEDVKTYDNPAALRDICGSVQWREKGHDLSKALNDLDTHYVNNYDIDANNTIDDCSGIDAFVDDGNSAGAVAGAAPLNSQSFNITLPAQEGCYDINLIAYEYDRYVGAYNDVYQPYAGKTKENTDRAELCRGTDADGGFWTLTPVKLHSEHDAGSVITPTTVAGSANRIQYQSRTMSWKDDPASGTRTTEEGDLRVRYEISVTLP